MVQEKAELFIVLGIQLTPGAFCVRENNGKYSFDNYEWDDNEDTAVNGTQSLLNGGPICLWPLGPM